MVGYVNPVCMVDYVQCTIYHYYYFIIITVLLLLVVVVVVVYELDRIW